MLFYILTYHQSECFSLPKEEPLSTCFPQLPVFRNVTPSTSYISDQVVAPSRSWSTSRYFMSTGYPFCDSDCPSVVTFPLHLFHPSVFAFSYVPDNVCNPTLFADPVCTLSVLQGVSYHDDLHLPVCCDQFFKLGVAKRTSLTTICHYWKYTFVKCFPLQFRRHIFV